AFACNGGVEFDHRFAAFDWRVGTSCNDAAALDEALPRIRADETIHSKSSRGEKQIADRMGWLHGGDHTKFSEPGNIVWIDNLRVLDAPARFANSPFVGRHGFERLLVKIENQSVGAIADGVRFHLDAPAQRFFKHRPEFFGFLPEKTGSFGRVAVRF